jgi:hypothetical protein
MRTQNRFKTESEFIRDYGKEWQATFYGRGSSCPLMPALGEPFNKTGLHLKVPRCTGRHNILPEMLTDTPIIPIGAIVKFPAKPSAYLKDRYDSVPCIAISKMPDAIVTYAGIANNSHRLKVDSLSTRRYAYGYFTAAEVYKGYELNYLLSHPFTPEQAFEYREPSKWHFFGPTFDTPASPANNVVIVKARRSGWTASRLGSIIPDSDDTFFKVWEKEINSPKPIKEYENKSTTQGQAVSVRANAIKITRSNLQGRPIFQGGAVKATIVSGSFGY